MGTCCSVKDSKSVNDEIYTNNMLGIIQTENKSESMPIFREDSELSSHNMILNSIINKYYKSDFFVDKITLERLWNIIKLFKDDYSNCEYIIHDLRTNLQRNENFIKKFKTINYSLAELSLINGTSLASFKKFIENKKLIIICPEDGLYETNSFLNLLKTNAINCSVYFLVNDLLVDKNNYTNTLLSLLDMKYFKEYPYILLPLKHFPKLKSESFIFLEYSSANNKKNYQKYFTENKLSSSLIKLMNNTKVALIIDISSVNSNEASIIELKIKDLENPCKILKLNISTKQDLIANKDKLFNMINSIKLELALNRSIIIQISEETDVELLFFTICLLINKITEVSFDSLKSYFKDNFYFIKNINEKVNELIPK